MIFFREIQAICSLCCNRFSLQHYVHIRVQTDLFSSLAQTDVHSYCSHSNQTAFWPIRAPVLNMYSEHVQQSRTAFVTFARHDYNLFTHINVV